MNDSDLRLLREGLTRAVQSAPDPQAALDGFGWRQLLADEPQAAVSTLFALHGSQLLPGSFLEDVLLAAAGIDGAARVVLPPPGRAAPASTCTADRVTVDGVVQAGAGAVLVPARDEAGDIVLVHADLDVAAPTGGLDPDAGWVVVERCKRAVHGMTPAPWPALVAAGRRALATELTALGGVMLATSVEHVVTRRQFGRPLGAFQAVQQALAEVRLWQETAELAVDAAWEDGSPESAAAAKVLSTRFTSSARLHCQQVLGGMGFTWEFPFHRYLRRALVLEPLLGSAATIRAELGAAVREQRVPALAGL